MPETIVERDAACAAEVVHSYDVDVPELALILGSGLGALAEEVTGAVSVATTELPGYPRSTVEGHAGRLVFGRLEGRPVVFVQGRVHFYEGHALQALGFPVRLVHALGARRLLVTNAAGGINAAFTPGTLMFITDHINTAFTNPLSTLRPPPSALRSPLTTRRSPPYDPDWLDRAEHLALELKIPTRRGVYLFTHGPSYETKAEIRAFARLGADAVGMSTVPEVRQARRLGMKVLGISTITNPAAGVKRGPLRHEDVLAAGRRVRAVLSRLVRAIVRET